MRIGTRCLTSGEEIEKRRGVGVFVKDDLPPVPAVEQVIDDPPGAQRPMRRTAGEPIGEPYDRRCYSGMSRLYFLPFAFRW